MKSLTHHIVRRGIDAHFSYQAGGDHPQHNPLTPVAITILIFTAIVYLVAIVLAEYTYGYLIPTLAMVETPTALLIESTTTTEDKEESFDKDGSLDKEPLLEQCEVTLVQQAPITTSIRKTVRHLRSIGGCLALYRGFSFFAVNGLLLSQLTVIFSFIPFNIGRIIAATIIATIRMGWTHVVISSPSPLPWFRRIPSIKTFKSIAPITALAALCEELSIILPLGLALALGLGTDLSGSTETDINVQACMLKMIAVAALFFSWIILVVVPVTTVLTRIHASLLPEGEDTIITVHRENTGEGETDSETEGPVAMTIKEAWKSVDWNARMRIYKTYAKGFGIQMSIVFLFSAILYTELVVFLGPKFPEVLTQLMLMV